MNMFVAIMDLTHKEVRKEIQRETDFMLSDYIRLKYAGVKANISTDKWILDLYFVIKMANDSQLDFIEFKFWKKILKEKGYSPVEIDVMFSKFDKDGDRKINETEKLRMEKYLINARNKMKQEMMRAKQEAKQRVTNEWIFDLTYVLDRAKEQQVDKLSFDFFKNLLEKRGYTAVEMKELFEKFDKDEDENLSKAEQTRMEKYLAKAMVKYKLIE